MARIDQVAGIGHKEATKLRKAGVRTSKGLIEAASDRKGRVDLAEATGIDQREISSSGSIIPTSSASRGSAPNTPSC